MPKRNFIPVQLAPEQYDKCVDCPLIGLIPENERKACKRIDAERRQLSLF